MAKIVLIGPPGSGKGTQATLLKDFYNNAHISSGDVLRSEVAKSTDFGRQIKSFMDKGEIGPVELITEVILQHLDNNCPDSFILDGFPRTLYQAEELGKRHTIDAVFFINVPVDDIVQRITGRRICVCGNIYHVDFSPSPQDKNCECGKELILRSDDNEETVRNRIRIYNEETMPVIDYYQKAGILQNIDGTIAPQNIFENIKKLLN